MCAYILLSTVISGPGDRTETEHFQFGVDGVAPSSFRLKPCPEHGAGYYVVLGNHAVTPVTDIRDVELSAATKGNLVVAGCLRRVARLGQISANHSENGRPNLKACLYSSWS